MTSGRIDAYALSYLGKLLQMHYPDMDGKFGVPIV